VYSIETAFAANAGPHGLVHPNSAPERPRLARFSRPAAIWQAWFTMTAVASSCSFPTAVIRSPTRIRRGRIGPPVLAAARGPFARSGGNWSASPFREPKSGLRDVAILYSTYVAELEQKGASPCNAAGPLRSSSGGTACGKMPAGIWMRGAEEGPPLLHARACRRHVLIASFIHTV